MNKIDPVPDLPHHKGSTSFRANPPPEGEFRTFAIFAIAIGLFVSPVSFAHEPDVLLAAKGNYHAAPSPLIWSNTPSKNPPQYYFPNPLRPYMRRLNENYRIAEMTSDARTDLDRVRIVCNWVNQQWEHRGDCPPQKNDPIAILEAARTGLSFSCYEYSLVAAGCLNSIGVKTRIIVLLPQDVELRPAGHYHVVAEAYLRDKKKWVMLDPQWNAIPTLNNYPLSVVELQNAIARLMGGLDFGNLPDHMINLYPRDFVVYAHFLYTPTDNRVIGATAPELIPGGVMLIPPAEKPPSSFARAPLSRIFVTHTVSDFYPPMKN